MDNYPPGVTSKDFDDKVYEYSEKEVILEDVEVDTGQGKYSGDLIADFCQKTNGDIELISKLQFIPIGNNGQELGILHLNESELDKTTLDLIYNKAEKEFSK